MRVGRELLAHWPLPLEGVRSSTRPRGEAPEPSSGRGVPTSPGCRKAVQTGGLQPSRPLLPALELGYRLVGAW